MARRHARHSVARGAVGRSVRRTRSKDAKVLAYEAQAGAASGQNANHHEKAVHLSRCAQMMNRHAGLHEALRVGFAFVAQHVVLGGDDDRLRQTREVAFPQRRGEARLEWRSASVGA